MTGETDRSRPRAGATRSTTALIAATLLGCGGRGVPAAETTIRDSAGVSIATSAGVDRPAPGRLETIATIGGADSGIERLGGLTQANVGADTLGRIYVLVAEDARVSVFDTTGRPLATVGRKGAGPGEFNGPASLDVDPTGRIAVQDYTKNGLVAFDRQWSTVPPIRLNPILDKLFGAIRLQGDALLVHAKEWSESGQPEKLWHFSPRDSVALATLITAPPIGELFACNRYHIRGLPRAFEAQMTWHAGVDAVLINDVHRYRVDVFRGTRLTQRIQRQVAMQPATPAMIERLYPNGRTYGGPECTVPPDQIARDLGAADQIPTISQVAIDLQGRFWVGRFTFPDEPPLTDLFASDGRYLGTFNGLRAPLAFPARGLIVVPVVDSTTDVSRLEVRRLVPD